jgi:hypothetical protein
MHVSGSHTRRSGVGRRFRNANQEFTVIGPSNPAVIVVEQPPTTSATGIRGRFHGGQPGRALLTVLKPGCPAGSGCGSAGSTSSEFVVFA